VRKRKINKKKHLVIKLRAEKISSPSPPNDNFPDSDDDAPIRRSLTSSTSFQKVHTPWLRPSTPRPSSPTFTRSVQPLRDLTLLLCTVLCLRVGVRVGISARISGSTRSRRLGFVSCFPDLIRYELRWLFAEPTRICDGVSDIWRRCASSASSLSNHFCLLVVSFLGWIEHGSLVIVGWNYFQVMLKSQEKLTAKPGNRIESLLLGSLFAEQVSIRVCNVQSS
jgi:hypothetical protein